MKSFSGAKTFAPENVGTTFTSCSKNIYWGYILLQDAGNIAGNIPTLLGLPSKFGERDNQQANKWTKYLQTVICPV